MAVKRGKWYPGLLVTTKTLNSRGQREPMPALIANPDAMNGTALAVVVGMRGDKALLLWSTRHVTEAPIILLEQLTWW